MNIYPNLMDNKMTDKKKKFIKAETAEKLLKKEPEKAKRTVSEIRQKMYGKEK